MKNVVDDKVTPLSVFFPGKGLLRYYNSSMSALLQAVYSNHQWDRWRFVKAQNNYWNIMSSTTNEKDVRELRSFLETLAVKLHIKSEGKAEYPLESWYQVSLEKFKSDSIRISQVGGLARALRLAYPQHNWDETRFKRRTRTRTITQRRIESLVTNIVPNAR